MDDYPWVLVGHWSDSSDTLHGPYRSSDAAEDAGRLAWSGLDRCTGWDVLLLGDGPVPAPPRAVSTSIDDRRRLR